MTFLDPVFNPWLLPLLEWNAFLGIFLVSLFVSFVVTVVYKFATNQSEMKRLKDKQKEFQVTMKSQKDNPAEMMKTQKQAMAVSFEYMKQSFKPTLITMIPVLLIFSWMAGHLAFNPLYPTESYSVTAHFKDGVVGNTTLLVPVGSEVMGEATKVVSSDVLWQVKSPEGVHSLTVAFGDQKQVKSVLVGTRLMYESQIEVYQHSDIEKISLGYTKFAPLGTFTVFGWQPGWLALYIIFSLAFSMILRKVMNIY